MPAPTLVQSAVATAASVAYSGDVTSGNLLIVVAGSQDTSGGVTFAVSDTRGNTWSSLSLVDANPLGGGRGQLFYAIAKDSGPCTVSITTTSATPQIFVGEASNAAFLDAQHAATGSGASPDSGTINTNAAVEFLFSFAINKPSSATGNAPGVGWTQAQTINSGTRQSQFEYQVTAASGAFNGTSTITLSGKGPTNFWLAQVVSFSQTPVSSGIKGAMMTMFAGS